MIRSAAPKTIFKKSAPSLTVRRITLRLDKYLKISRIIKRRTVANEACDAGRVLINGKAVRASYAVKPGDVVEISFGTHTVKAEILSTNEYAKKDEAASMYKILEN